MGLSTGQTEMRPVVIVGAGYPLEPLVKLVAAAPQWHLAAVLDPQRACHGKCIADQRVLGWLDMWPQGVCDAIIGMPAVAGGFDREALFQLLTKRGIGMPALASERAACSLSLPAGTILLDDVQVEDDVDLGVLCLVGPGKHLRQGSQVPDFAYVHDGSDLTETQPPPRSLAAMIASASDSVRSVIRKINRSRMEMVLVTDADQHLQGVVTDGDVRRGILADIDLDGPVASIMNVAPHKVLEGTPQDVILNMMRRYSIRHMPVVDADGVLLRVEVMERLIAAPPAGEAVIMAGGLGQRLRPYTENTPKPLVPVGGRPILDHLLQEMHNSGIYDVAIAINYRGEDVRQHVGDGHRFGVNVNYLAEEQRLGTAGALSLIEPRPKQPFLVVNGDVLTRLNFERLFEFFHAGSYDLIMCVRPYETTIPYGVVQLRGGVVDGLTEKPVYRHFVNAGVYVVDPACLDHVPTSTYYDMPTLVNTILSSGGRVGAFPVIEYWRDIGTPDDLHTASVEQQNLAAQVTLPAAEMQYAASA